MKDEIEYLQDFELAIYALKGVAAENPTLSARLTVIADKCQTAYGFLECAFQHDARERHQHRLKTND